MKIVRKIVGLLILMLGYVSAMMLYSFDGLKRYAPILSYIILVIAMSVGARLIFNKDKRIRR